MARPEQIEDWRNPYFVSRMAEPLYSEDAIYRTHAHGLTTAIKGSKIAEFALLNGVVGVEPDLVFAEGAFHDIGSLLIPGTDHPYETREEYAGVTGADIMLSLGMPPSKKEDFIEDTKSTKLSVPCTSKNGVCLVRADLSNLLATEVEFLATTLAVFRDDGGLEMDPLKLLAEDPDAFTAQFIKFAVKAHDPLMECLDSDLTLGSNDYDSDGLGFSDRAMRNVGLLKADVLGEILPGMLSQIVAYELPRLELPPKGQAVS